MCWNGKYSIIVIVVEPKQICAMVARARDRAFVHYIIHNGSESAGPTAEWRINQHAKQSNKLWKHLSARSLKTHANLSAVFASESLSGHSGLSLSLSAFVGSDFWQFISIGIKILFARPFFSSILCFSFCLSLIFISVLVSMPDCLSVRNWCLIAIVHVNARAVCTTTHNLPKLAWAFFMVQSARGRRAIYIFFLSSLLLAACIVSSKW